MAVTLTISRTSPTTVRLLMSSDLGGTPTFYVWRDGVLVASTQATAWDAAVPVGASPCFDVFDDADSEPDFILPRTVTVQWAANPSADHYLVKQYVGGSWLTRARLGETGRAYYHWTSGELADETEHSFRVIAVGADGNESTAAELLHTMVTVPEPPTDVTLTYEQSTGLVTIDA